MNSNSADLGGGIFNKGTVSVSNSTLSDNTSNGGGGIENAFAGNVTLSGSTLDGNSSTSLGGGIDNDGTATVSNSTFSGNSANYGGGIATNGTLSLSSSTLSGNSADLAFGGGLYVGNVNATTFGSSILAGNTAAVGPDCWASCATAISNGYNLIGRNDDCIPIPQTGDQSVATDWTRSIRCWVPSPRTAARPKPWRWVSRALRSTRSPSGHSASSTRPRSAPRPEPRTSAGTARPQGPACDMGAYELNSPWIFGRHGGLRRQRQLTERLGHDHLQPGDVVRHLDHVDPEEAQGGRREPERHVLRRSRGSCPGRCRFPRERSHPAPPRSRTRRRSAR